MTARRLRLLFLAPFPPRLDASHGGSRVIAQLVSRLAERHDVALCCLRGGNDAPVDEALSAKCRLVRETRLDHPAGMLNWIRLLGGTPLWAAGLHSPRFMAQVRETCAVFRPEIIQLEYHVMGQYLGAIEDYPAPRLLVEHEPGEAAAREVRAQARSGGLITSLDLRAWGRFERMVLSKAQAVVVFTPRDREMIASLSPESRIACIPPGAELPAQPLDPLGKEPASLLFFGSFSHPPNRDAAERLVDHIFPRVLQAEPEARLAIIGAQPPEDLRAAASGRVTVAGFVRDLRPYLDQASLVVVPLRLGGGLRVKVIDTLAAGKALVASSLAVAGLDLEDGRDYLQAETDEAFARAILALLRDPGKRADIARNGRRWACEHAGWEKSIEAYERLYRSLLF